MIAAAQRLAVEHRFTFEEDISVYGFLEEVSLLFQRYTSRPGARPFGCCLIVAFVEGSKSELYSIYPSGSVEKMGGVAAIGRDVDKLLPELGEVIYERNNTVSVDEVIDNVKAMLLKHLPYLNESNQTFLTAELSFEREFVTSFTT